MLTEEELIQGCKDFSRKAQKELYVSYAGRMRGICARYIRNEEEAKDVLQEGFIKIFSNIHKYAGKGSLEGWMKRIMINTAITYYNKTKNGNTVRIDDDEIDIANAEEEDEDNESFLTVVSKAELPQETILASLDILSDSYRVVFNMYYFESYSHKEISEILGIDEKTSRSRLFRGRKNLQEHLYQICEKRKADSKVLR